MQASQDIAESASGSINLSAQKNIIGHAQDKISLFAAQKGLRAYAAKGKLELQAQDDAIEAIAKKVIKLISTEDKIELTSPKEIVLTAGGSQLKINANGVFSTTGGKFESKAGQHLFTSGAKVSYEVPELPSSGPFTKAFHFVSLEGEKIENAIIQVYEKINDSYKFKIGSKIDKSIFKLDESEENIEYKALVGFDDWVSWFEEEEEGEEVEEIDLGEHYNPFDK